MTKDWHFNIKHKNKIKVLLKVSGVHSWSKLVWLTFQFSYSVGCFIRWLSVSRNFTNGKLWFRISPFLEFELAESLIICSLYLTKSVSDSRVCQERAETQISMRRGRDEMRRCVKCYMWDTMGEGCGGQTWHLYFRLKHRAVLNQANASHVGLSQSLALNPLFKTPQFPFIVCYLATSEVMTISELCQPLAWSVVQSWAEPAAAGGWRCLAERSCTACCQRGKPEKANSW